MYICNMNKIKETRVFMNGPSQAVRIPKEFRMNCKVVDIKRVEGGLLILPKESRFESMKSALTEFTDDFMSTREQGGFEDRESF